MEKDTPERTARCRVRTTVSIMVRIRPLFVLQRHAGLDSDDADGPPRGARILLRLPAAAPKSSPAAPHHLARNPVDPSCTFAASTRSGGIHGRGKDWGGVSDGRLTTASTIRPAGLWRSTRSGGTGAGCLTDVPPRPPQSDHLCRPVERPNQPKPPDQQHSLLTATTGETATPSTRSTAPRRRRAIETQPHRRGD